MDLLSQNIPLIVYKNPVNMHRSFNGLLSLAINELNLNPQDDVYILISTFVLQSFRLHVLAYSNPGRCPGLLHCQPFGLRNDLNFLDRRSKIAIAQGIALGMLWVHMQSEGLQYKCRYQEKDVSFKDL